MPNSTYAQWLLDVAIKFTEKHKFDLALIAAQKAGKTASTPREKIRATDILYSLGDYHLNQNDFPRALRAYKETFSLTPPAYREMRTRLEGEIHLSQASDIQKRFENGNGKVSDLKMAHELFQKAVKNEEWKKNNTQKLPGVYYSLGLSAAYIAESFGENERGEQREWLHRSVKFMKEAQKTAKGCLSEDRLTHFERVANQNLGSVLDVLGENEKAREAWQAALDGGDPTFEEKEKSEIRNGLKCITCKEAIHSLLKDSVTPSPPNEDREDSFHALAHSAAKLLASDVDGHMERSVPFLRTFPPSSIVPFFQNHARLLSALSSLDGLEQNRFRNALLLESGVRKVDETQGSSIVHACSASDNPAEEMRKYARSFQGPSSKKDSFNLSSMPSWQEKKGGYLKRVSSEDCQYVSNEGEVLDPIHYMAIANSMGGAGGRRDSRGLRSGQKNDFENNFKKAPIGGTVFFVKNMQVYVSGTTIKGIEQIGGTSRVSSRTLSH